MKKLFLRGRYAQSSFCSGSNFDSTGDFVKVSFSSLIVMLVLTISLTAVGQHLECGRASDAAF